MLLLDLPEGGTVEPSQLGPGRSYCIVLRSEQQRKTLLNNLSGLQGASIVAHDGGLISNLNGWANLALPVSYHAVQVIGGMQQRVRELFAGCGMSDWQQVKTLLGRSPAELSLYEKRLLGFVRAMLVEPELMVYDSIYEGLVHDDVERVRQFDRLFHLYFPFRASVLLSFDGYNDEGRVPAAQAAPA